MSFRGRLDGAAVEVEVGPDALHVGERALPWTDLDGFAPRDHAVLLTPVDAPPVALTHLGAAYDRFVAEATEARARARRAALLAWTGDAPLAAFAAKRGQDRVTIQLFPDGCTVEPLEGAPDLVPFGCLDRVERDGYELRLVRRGLPPVDVRHLGKRTDEFLARLAAARADSAARVDAAFTELDPGLAGLGAGDGWAIDRAAADGRWSTLRGAVSAHRRDAELRVLEELAGSRLRLGVKTGVRGGVIPFALAPAAGRVAVEATDADDRATFVFACDDVDRLNAVLLLTSFRREALTAPEDALGRWGLAVRTSPVVRWARAALVARVVHDARWTDGVRAAMTDRVAADA